MVFLGLLTAPFEHVLKSRGQERQIDGILMKISTYMYHRIYKRLVCKIAKYNLKDQRNEPAEQPSSQAYRSCA